MNRANILWQLGRYEKAREAFAEAVSFANQSGGQNKHLLAWLELFQAEMALSVRDFEGAISGSQKSLTMAGTQYKDIAARSKSTLGLAQALSGMRSAGIRSCQDGINLAKSTGSPRLNSGGQLALSEALLEAGNDREALKAALAAQESFAGARQRHSEWRAWLIAATASRRLGDQTSARDYAARADKLLAEMRQQWGEDIFNGYLARPDVRYYRQRVSDILAEG
jgi:tetratricopeptide (TPR) repeat protein